MMSATAPEAKEIAAIAYHWSQPVCLLLAKIETLHPSVPMPTGLGASASA
jgi:hypothetical protein